jgi:hypothetical protein
MEGEREMKGFKGRWKDEGWEGRGMKTDLGEDGEKRMQRLGDEGGVRGRWREDRWRLRGG